MNISKKEKIEVYTNLFKNGTTVIKKEKHKEENAVVICVSFCRVFMTSEVYLNNK